MNIGKIWLASLAVSVGIFAVVYFTVIKPTTETANEAVKTGLQQSQQALDQSQQQLNNSGAATKSANKQLDQAQKLTQCLSEAGTDTSAVQACESKYQP
jgi:uncharacterized membrane-anchored protein YhcB (DUF1043 family)